MFRDVIHGDGRSDWGKGSVGGGCKVTVTKGKTDLFDSRKDEVLNHNDKRDGPCVREVEERTSKK